MNFLERGFTGTFGAIQLAIYPLQKVGFYLSNKIMKNQKVYEELTKRCRNMGPALIKTAYHNDFSIWQQFHKDHP